MRRMMKSDPDNSVFGRSFKETRVPVCLPNFCRNFNLSQNFVQDGIPAKFRAKTIHIYKKIISLPIRTKRKKILIDEADHHQIRAAGGSCAQHRQEEPS